MTWNHRVIRTYDERTGETTYEICECHYKNKDDAIPNSWSDPVTVAAETRTGLLWVLSVMTESLAKPVLERQGGKLIEVEPTQEFADDLWKVIKANKEHAQRMA